MTDLSRIAPTSFHRTLCGEVVEFIGRTHTGSLVFLGPTLGLFATSRTGLNLSRPECQITGACTILPPECSDAATGNGLGEEKDLIPATLAAEESENLSLYDAWFIKAGANHSYAKQWRDE